MPPVKSQKYRLSWPLNAEQVENIDSMIEDLYRQLTLNAPIGDPGDVFFADEDGNLDGLDLGTEGTFLRAGADAPEWSTLVLPNSAVIGDIPYASAANVLSMLADVATGNALISGGVGVAPSWGKIGLTTHVSGILPVDNGGTGRASHTAYAVICGGTTATGAQQSVAALGASGTVLTSNGAGALPTFQTAAGGAPTTQTTTLTGAQADFAFSAAFTFLRCNNASTLTFSGFSGPGGVTATGGDRAMLVAINTNVQILNQNAGSASTNRVITPGGVTLELSVGYGCLLVYDGTTSRWRVVEEGMYMGQPVTNATAGSILFADTAGVLAQDNANLFWDNGNNRLGLGTAVPLSRLHINGASNGWILQDEQDSDPTTTELDSLDSVAIYNKNNKFVIAYNNAGAITYISIPLDGSTTTWTHNTSAP